MTSEVVLMNRSGVALAADSAATVGSGQNRKIYNSAVKLFSLTKYHPVGAMIYNDSDFMGLPWETIIKYYRDILGTKSMEFLEGYGKNLIDFLHKNYEIFPESSQDYIYKKKVKDYFERINSSIRDNFLKKVLGQEVKSSYKISDEAKAQISEQHCRLKELDDLNCFYNGFWDALNEKYQGEIENLIEEIFDNYDLEQEQKNCLHDISKFIITKDFFFDSYTGLVIAGFGEKELFPAMTSFLVDGLFLGMLKYKEMGEEKIEVDGRPVIQPFAQSNMIDSFLDGIDPNFDEKIEEEVLNLAIDIPNAVIDSIDDLSNEQKDHWKNNITQHIKNGLSQFFQSLRDYRLGNHVFPAYAAINNLPKDELASTAEALVNLNSFQKRVSLEDETVGGPIDVAVITKGDGLVWIKRKHYFDPELNHHFFRNYYQNKDSSS